SAVKQHHRRQDPSLHPENPKARLEQLPREQEAITSWENGNRAGPRFLVLQRYLPVLRAIDPKNVRAWEKSRLKYRDMGDTSQEVAPLRSRRHPDHKQG